MIIGEEVLGRHLVEKGNEIIVIAIDIEQADRLAVLAQLPPGPYLEQFLHRADTTRQGDEGVGEVRHLGLARMHGLHDIERAQIEMGDFLQGEKFGDHANNPAASLHRRIRQLPHQADLTTAKDDLDTDPGEMGADILRRGSKGRIAARI